jgi:hypothetical protein
MSLVSIKTENPFRAKMRFLRIIPQTNGSLEDFAGIAVYQHGRRLSRKATEGLKP